MKRGKSKKVLKISFMPISQDLILLLKVHDTCSAHLSLIKSHNFCGLYRVWAQVKPWLEELGRLVIDKSIQLWTYLHKEFPGSSTYILGAKLFCEPDVHTSLTHSVRPLSVRSVTVFSRYTTSRKPFSTQNLNIIVFEKITNLCKIHCIPYSVLSFFFLSTVIFYSFSACVSS